MTPGAQSTDLLSGLSAKQDFGVLAVRFRLRTRLRAHDRLKFRLQLRSGSRIRNRSVARDQCSSRSRSSTATNPKPRAKPWLVSRCFLRSRFICTFFSSYSSSGMEKCSVPIQSSLPDTVTEGAERG